jgi:hypothetical protein
MKQHNISGFRAGVGTSDRSRQARWCAEERRLAIVAYRVSLKRALNQPDLVRRASAMKSAEKEITQLVTTTAVLPTKRALMTRAQISGMIPAHSFIKEKEHADGTFDKTKCRMVAGGNFIDSATVGETYAPVMFPASLMIMLNLAAIDGDEIGTCDIDGAYLVPDLIPGEEPIFVHIDAVQAAILVRLFPRFADCLEADGGMILKLGKYLYGLPQAGNRFYMFLKAVFLSMHFVATPEDQCLFSRGEGASRVVAGSHVDDIISKGKSLALDRFYAEFRSKFKITIERGPHISFTGLSITRQGPKLISVAQTGYRRTLISRFSADIARVKRVQKVPAPPWLLHPAPANDPPYDKTHYLSMIMSVMFMARLTRVDLLFVCVYLATFTSAPTMSHYLHACRLLKYIADSPNYGILYKGQTNGQQVTCRVYSDGAEGTHASGHGQCGIVVTLNSGYICARSSKVTMVTLSASEVERFASAEGATYAVFVTAIIPRFGHKLDGPVHMHMDSTAAEAAISREGPFARNKHILYKKGFVKELKEQGVIDTTHTPGKDLVADMLTKPMPYDPLLRHIKKAGLVSLAT